MTLLRYWGDAEHLMNEYMEEADLQEEAEKREQMEKKQQNKAEAAQREKREKEQLVRKRVEEEMNKLRASLDSGAILSSEDERRLMLWEQDGQADSQTDVRDSMALMLYQGTGSRMNAATMRNQKAIQQIMKIKQSKVE